MMVKFECDGVTHHVNTEHVVNMQYSTDFVTGRTLLAINFVSGKMLIVPHDDGSIVRLISNAIGVHVEPVAEDKTKRDATTDEAESDESKGSISNWLLSCLFAMFIRCVGFAVKLRARVDGLRSRLNGCIAVESKPHPATPQPDGGRVKESMYRETIRFLRGTKEGK